MGKFQLIIIVIFIIFAASGVFLFSSFRSGQNVSDIEITVWGQESKEKFDTFLREFDINTERAFNVVYEEINSDNYADNVIEAIASGEEPDIVIISSNDLLRFEDKILAIPYETISERSFKDAFIEGGEIFLSTDGILGLPISVDPLVMYWNRDILQSNGFSAPPRFWTEMFLFSERVTERDDALNITRSAIALGDYENIENAKEIILSLLNQNGNSVISTNRETGQRRVVLSESFGKSTVPAESVMRFYTEFSNPTKTSYSWNRALPNSQDAFVSGDLALYFGFASELSEIQAKNPNLNFDVALFPQSNEGISSTLYGEIKGISILKRSPNINVAVAVASTLTRSDNILSYSSISNLPPVRRDLLSVLPGTQFEDLFYESALIARPFLDPDTRKTNDIFKGMVERIVSGRERVSQSVRRASTELSAFFIGQ